VNENVREYYDRSVLNEWTRLERHPLEYATTRRALKAYLPPACTVLDVGAGPGRYSLELAGMGHRVTLVDLSPRAVSFAQEKAAEHDVALECLVADATDLSLLGDTVFDAVLLMGPLYHLLDQGQRDQAVREAVRVLRVGGVLVASFINRFGFLVDALTNAPASLMRLSHAQLRQRLSDGIRRAEEYPDSFTDSHSVHPREIEPLMTRHGLMTLRLMAAGLHGAG